MLFDRDIKSRFDAQEQASMPRFQRYSIALKNAVDTL